MPPPELPTDTPVLNIAHPREVGIFPLLRNEFDGSAFYGLNRGTCEFFRVDIPLKRQPGLNHDARAIATWHLQAVIFDFV